MSENVEGSIPSLEQEKQVAEELLYIVLNHIGEPVVINIDEAKASMRNDRFIDISLNVEENTWTLQVKTIE